MLTTLILFSALLGTGPAAGLPQLSEGLVEPRLVGPEISSELDSYSIGGLELDLATGQIFPVAVEDRRVGFFFFGDGRFSYAADEPIAADLFELNARRASPYKVSDGAVEGKLDAALVLDSRMASSGKAIEAVQLPERLAKSFARHLERSADDRLIDAPNQIAQAILDVSGAPIVIARLETGKAELLFRYDELATGEESLSIMERYANTSALRGHRLPVPLVTRPLTDDWLGRQAPRFALRHVDLELVNPADADLELVVEERLEALVPLDTLEFSLWSETFYRRKKFDYLLTSVTAENGAALPFSHRNGDLVVELPAIVQAGDEVVLRFGLEGEILHRPGGNSYWWLPIGSWLPLPPRFDMRSFTVHGVARVADPFVPFGMGTTLERWEEPGLSCLEFELSDPVQFAVVMAGKYHSYTETREDQTITLSSYAFARDEPMKEIAHNVFELIDWYEERLGAFPYPELNIVEINDFGFGIGPPGVIYLTAEGFDPGPSGRSFRKEVNMRLSHEVAHMWWGHVAQMKTPEDQWLSESTAEYFAALAVDDLVGRDGYKDAMRDWRAEADNSKQSSNLYLANHLAGERAGFDRRNLLYAHGPLMLHEFRQAIGDDAFFEIMRRFVDESRFEHVDTRGFIELASEVTGMDQTEWFREHLFGLETPGVIPSLAPAPTSRPSSAPGH